MTGFKYKAFVCYSHADRKWADWLHRELERYRAPKRLAPAAGGRGARCLRPIFKDREELPSASCLPSLIHDALEQSESLIVICSPLATQSKWVNQEIQAFRETGRGHRIFCLIVDGEPYTGDSTECFPQALRTDKSVDEPGTIEPIAADLRPGGDGKKRALQKVIAGLLGVGLDDLVQRELHQRHQRLLVVAAGTSLVALVMSGLAIFAFASRQEAELRREDAEHLVGFMVGDLRQKLNEGGRLEVLDAVADQAMTYFSSLGNENARDEVLAMRAETLRQIGRVRIDRAMIADAEQAFIESMEISTRLVSRDPKRIDWQIGLANDHFYLGFLQWQRGNLASAREAFQAQLSIVDSVSTSNPQNAELLSERLYAWTNFGRVLEAQGQFEQAQDAYSQVMDCSEQLIQLEPDNLEWELELGFAHNNFGKLSVSLGRMDEAAEHYGIDLEIKRRVHLTRPSHNVWREYLGVSQYYWGDVMRQRGDYERAHESLREAREIFEQLLLYNEEALAPWQHRLAVVQQSMAKVYRAQGNSGQSLESILGSIRILVAITQLDPGNIVWRNDLGWSHLEAARVYLAMPATDLAKQQAEAAAVIADDDLLENPQSRSAIQLKAGSLLALGDVSSASKMPDAAYSSWKDGLERLEASLAGTTDPTVLELQGALLIRLDREKEANALFARLQKTGYHPEEAGWSIIRAMRS